MTHPLKLVDKMSKYEMDPDGIVEDTERTTFCPQTDEQTDGRKDGQGETSIPVFNFVERGYNKLFIIYHGQFPPEYNARQNTPPPPPPPIISNLAYKERAGLSFVRSSQSPVNSLHKGQWGGALMFSLICVWINGWVNNPEAGDLRCYRAHYDVTVMLGYAITINTLRLRQNGYHFADDFFKCIFLNVNFWISNNMSLKCVTQSQIDNISSFVQPIRRQAITWTNDGFDW